MPDARIPDGELTVAEAFARLPQEAPDRSAWPLLEERIAASRPPARPRWPFLLAAAAVLATAAVMPRLLGEPALSPPELVREVPAAGNDRLDALMAESAQLESFISTVSSDGMASANAALLGLEFEERLQRLDTTLSDPGLDAGTRLALWQRRVALLREYAGVQGTAQWLAAQGDKLDGALVATF